MTLHVQATNGALHQCVVDTADAGAICSTLASRGIPFYCEALPANRTRILVDQGHYKYLSELCGAAEFFEIDVHSPKFNAAVMQYISEEVVNTDVDISWDSTSISVVDDEVHINGIVSLAVPLAEIKRLMLRESQATRSEPAQR